MSTIMYEQHLFEEIGKNEDYPLQGMAPYYVTVKAAGPRAASFVLDLTPVTIIDPATLSHAGSVPCQEHSYATTSASVPRVPEFTG